MSAFANCGRAVAHVRGSYVPTAEVARLFDHLVGTTKQSRRQFEAKRFRCPQVDHQSAPELAIHSASRPSSSASCGRTPTAQPVGGGAASCFGSFGSGRGRAFNFSWGGARRREWVQPGCVASLRDLPRPHGGFGLYRPPPPKRAGSKPISLTGFDVKQQFQTARVDVAGSGPSILSLKFEQRYELSPRRIGTQSQIVSNRPDTR